MKVFFIQEARYVEFNEELYSPRIEYNTYWGRYLEHFSVVTIVARVKKVTVIPDGYLKATGANVNFHPIVPYEGPLGLLKNIFKVKKQLREILNKKDSYILRIPGLLGFLIYKELRKERINYTVEVVGDPYEVVNNSTFFYILNKPVGLWSLKKMKDVVKNAFAAIYVTKYNLQKRYPANKNAIKGNASNVIIPDKYLLTNLDTRFFKIKTLSNRLKPSSNQKVRIGVVGMLYTIKSPLEIVEVVSTLINDGLNIELNFAGDGPLLEEIIVLSEKLNIKDNVICHGRISSKDLMFSFMDKIDLYIQFSKTEGLPRALIEAMSRGCPVISSNVGGINELLPADMLVNSGDSVDLSIKINNLLKDNQRVKKAAIENLNTSKNYIESKLKEKRSIFYSKVFKQKSQFLN